ncbi:strawberry notch-like NTP hydrolase domain-containing protein [Asticcacaulis sp. W401b]|uniref:strawberry notch-like NTP hydrolase domain-containing protein n=1 Tax=Asticcacaulis sp. W401b TaxID=3388666 RepID=UPI00397066E2
MSLNLSLFDAKPDKAASTLAAARALANLLSRNRRLDRTLVREAMSFAFMGSDADGVWAWKDAYDAIEAAQVLQVRKLAGPLSRLEDTSVEVVTALSGIAALGLTHSRRSEEQVALDQFSTPLEIAALCVLGAQVRPGDVVLEPSAGTGLLAILAEICGASLHLNEIAGHRAEVIEGLFPSAGRTRFDGAVLHDRLPVSGSLDAVVMNPPFQYLEAHLLSAAKALADNGRVSAIVPASFFTGEAVLRLSRLFAVRAMILLPTGSFDKHGTHVETGLLVFDRAAGDGVLPPVAMPETLEAAIGIVLAIPDRLTAKARIFRPSAAGVVSGLRSGGLVASSRFGFLQTTDEVEYQPRAWGGSGDDVGLYSGYRVSRMVLAHAVAHPSNLVESAAMGSVSPPEPAYRPRLPRTVIEGGLSDAQMETVIYAGQAHEKILPGFWALNEAKTGYGAVKDDHPGGFQLRGGYFIGDGTGVGKGRQISAIIADNVARGRVKAVWLSKNEELLEDARRDWTAIGGSLGDLVPQSGYKLGQTIRADKAILFSTYATLRVAGRQGKASRLDQIVDWLGADFDGVLVFDEAHEMANAAGGKGNRGVKKPSQQGLAGLMLQYRLPNARVVYVSATGATTPENLGYACRLGLWGSVEAPFLTRDDFLKAADSGGVAVMELIARELKAQGLYTARMLSFEGVTIEPLIHELTPSNIEIWDAWAEAFEIIHAGLEKALEATGITSDGETLSGQARSAAKSAFASTAQRFFNALLCGFKAPTVIRAIEADGAADLASVVQLVSTNQAVLDRRLDQVSPTEWNDLSIDLTPRDTVTEYLQNAFPTTCMQVVTDDNGNEVTVPMKDATGNAIESQEALALREELILSLATLPGVPGVLDALVHHFGPERLSEITGRSRRVIRKDDRLVLERRPSASARTETDDFMSGRKKVLVFSQAGGTGRSYHADRACGNQRHRQHYLVESGWRADAAIQGIGRTHRSNQACAPCFRPVMTDIRGEKRFLSTIARRLDTLGALTKGERRSAGGGLFRPEDNLENEWARRALHAFYAAMYRGQVACMAISDFERKTALSLRDGEGSLKEPDDLPPLHTFLNRLLALRITDQNALFDDFETRLRAILEKAEASGQLDKGVEDLVPEAVELLDDTVVRVDPTGAQTHLLRFRVSEKRRVVSVSDMQARFERWPETRFDYVRNDKSGRFALVEHGITAAGDDDSLFPAVRLYRPVGSEVVFSTTYAESNWQVVDEAVWTEGWADEVAAIDPLVHSELFLVVGLLLPIWKHLPDKGCFVKRLRAPDGQTWLGRVLKERDALDLMRKLGVAMSDTLPGGEAARDLVMRDGVQVRLTCGLRLKKSLVMDRARLEVVSLDLSEIRRLKALGCFVEIINGSARAFVGDDTVLASVIGAYPVQEVLAAA